MIYKVQDELRFGSNIETFEKIPNGNWLVMQEEHSKEFYLKAVDTFIFPSKIYGEEEQIAERYLRTFSKNSKNMGALLTGLKGNGKTLLAKLICAKSELPVLLITQAYSGEAYQSFLANLGQEVVVFMDEFEKVYADEEKQEQLLSILDGIFETKILFLLTSNTLNINQYLKNRPGRIRYKREYDGLELEVMEEVISDLLEDKEKKEELKLVLQILSSVSMDVLLHLIQEMNDNDETAKEAIRHLNIQVEHSEFEVLMFIGGKRHTTRVHFNPLTTKYMDISYQEEVNGQTKWRWYDGNTDDMTVQVVNGEFVFKDREDNKLIFTPAKAFKFNI